MNRKPELILALDVDTIEKAKYFINILHPHIRIFKVGSQLFTGYGPRIINIIRKKGAEVFLDLKFFDIPNTVANAIRQAVRLEVKMLTLHITGGEVMLQRAVEAAKEESMRLKVERPLLLGVTVLTSQEAERQEILKLARLGLDSGLDGVVCSAQEAWYLRKKINRKFIIVTPGIRTDKAASDDQKRTATVQEALKAGSDFLVIGRQILKAQDPLSMAREFLKNMRRYE